jgi:hypothetical protein
MATQAMAEARILQDQLELYSKRGANQPAISSLARLQAERAALPPGDPRIAAYDAAIRKESEFAPAAAPAPTRNIANVNPNDFTPASVQKFNTSGDYGDLRAVVKVGANVAKAPSGYRVTSTGELEPIPGGPAAKFAELKQVPVHAQKAIVGASTAMQKIDNAIAALESGAEEATGMKGYLPDMALNRMYPKGTEARAAVADIGSLVMHERSGAAVTASESPRLKPFIPLITDDKATALKKLKRMRQIQADDAEALAGTYNEEQGFREFKTPVGKAAAPAAGGATGEWKVVK